MRKMAYLPLCVLNYCEDIVLTARICCDYVLFSKIAPYSFEKIVADVAKDYGYCWPVDAAAIRANAEKMQEYILIYEKKYGADARFKIRFDILAQTAEGAFKPVHFRVLAAVYSCIENGKIKWISRGILQHRASGFKSRKIMEMEENRLEPLTLRQIERSRDALSAKGFFSFATFANRMTFYGRCGIRKLVETVGEMVKRRNMRRLSAREKNEIIKKQAAGLGDAAPKIEIKIPERTNERERERAAARRYWAEKREKERRECDADLENLKSFIANTFKNEIKKR